MDSSKIIPQGNILKITEQLVIALMLMSCIFIIFEGAGLVHSALQYALILPFMNYFPLLFLFLAFTGLMGIFTGSRIPVYLFILTSFLGIFVQGIGLLLTPAGENVFLGTIFFQALCAGIVIFGLYTIFEQNNLSDPGRRKKLNEEVPVSTLEVRNLKKVYDLGEVKVHALKGVNIKLEKGEFVSIMGPSGCGKSTLLNLLGTLDRPTEGQIFIDGVDISLLTDDELAYLRNEKIGFIFQAYNLVPRMTVVQNVELPGIAMNMDPRVQRKRAIELLTKVGLGDKVHRKPKTLSGGEQQRVGLARALLNNPKILLCDEPTGNLDSKSGTRVMEIIAELRREFGVTIIVVTHDPQIASQTDRIFYLRDGLNVGMKENVILDM